MDQHPCGHLESPFPKELRLFWGQRDGGYKNIRKVFLMLGILSVKQPLKAYFPNHHSGFVENTHLCSFNRWHYVLWFAFVQHLSVLLKFNTLL
jgi:hypothetical protein